MDTSVVDFSEEPSSQGDLENSVEAGISTEDVPTVQEDGENIQSAVVEETMDHMDADTGTVDANIVDVDSNTGATNTGAVEKAVTSDDAAGEAPEDTTAKTEDDVTTEDVGTLEVDAVTTGDAGTIEEDADKIKVINGTTEIAQDDEVYHFMCLQFYIYMCVTYCKHI